MNADSTTEQIVSQGVLPLFYHEDAETCADIVRALYRAGFRVIEFTNRGPAAFSNMKILKDLCEREMPDAMVGIGTIKWAQDAIRFSAAGAPFLVSPGLNAEVAEVGRERNVPYIPGCMTPTEIMQAESLGIRTVKLFPGSVLGGQFVQNVRSLFPETQFLVTGGVTTQKENLAEWFRAGVSCVGLGSQLITKEIVNNRDFAALESNAREVYELVRVIRASAS